MLERSDGGVQGQLDGVFHPLVILQIWAGPSFKKGGLVNILVEQVAFDVDVFQHQHIGRFDQRCGARYFFPGQLVIVREDHDQKACAEDERKTKEQPLPEGSEHPKR